MPTRSVGSWLNGQVSAEVDYDASNRITGLRVINNSTVNAYLEIEQNSNNRKYGALFLGSTTTVIPIGTGVSVRISQILAPNGKWSGVTIRAQIPAS